MLRPLPYAGYEELEDTPHVMVDGAARPSTVAIFSHWPQSPTPTFLARDLSAGIVIDYLRMAAGGAVPPGAGASFEGVRGSVAQALAVTNDHFDEDGVMSVFCFVEPAAALERADLVVDVASCGDFGVVTEDEAAQIAFSLSKLAEGEGAADTSDSYRAVLPRLPELLDRPAAYERCWSDDFAALQATRAAIASGVVLLEEMPGDLCVVRAPDSPLSEVAVNSATPASRVLRLKGDKAELTLRYEGWVRYVSRPIPWRPDLEPLAARLSEEEPGATKWEANGVGAIIGRLAPVGEGRTELAPARLASIISDYLVSALPAWCPWREGGSYIPEPERASYTGKFQMGIQRSFSGSIFKSSLSSVASTSSRWVSRISRPGRDTKG